MKKVRTAVFPVGGLGTRFLPATKAMPKEMLTIVDKPLIQYAFEEAQAAGIEKFIFVTGRNKNVIANHFDHAYELQKVLEEKDKKEILALAKDWLPPAGSVAFTRQQEPLGLGHAVYCARNFIQDEPIAVLLADEMFLCKTPLLKQMVDAYEQNGGGNIIAVKEVSPEKTSSYGIISPEGDVSGNMIKVKSMVEKPKPEVAPSNLSIVGRYILEPQIFDFIETQNAGSGGEIQLTDAMNKMVSTTPTFGFKFDGKRYDCGNRRGFLEANIAFALDREDIKDDVMKILKKFVG
jgi:UTP--glucose-1-phosphate uridylyltransferase